MPHLGSFEADGVHIKRPYSEGVFLLQAIQELIDQILRH
jgi:hypothetical protein